MMKSTFISKVFDRKVKKYLQEVLSNFKIKMCFSGLGGMGSKASIILLLMKETIEFAIELKWYFACSILSEIKRIFDEINFLLK